MSSDPFTLAADAARVVAERTGRPAHDVVVVLGSGWADVADAIGAGVDVPLTEIPGFPAPTALGHRGSLRSTTVGPLRVLVLQGRAHLYEGHDPAVVVHGVRTAAAAGCRVAILTNAAGSLNSRWPVGQPVLVTDHVNLTGRSPLTGPPPPDGERFVDMTEAYSPRLRALAHTVDHDLREGVYVGFAGPQYETPAEIHMAGVIGGDLVGMSTVLETIAARHLGMEVLAVSLVSNLAAGISATPLDGAEVIAAAKAAAPRLGHLLRGVLDALAEEAG